MKIDQIIAERQQVNELIGGLKGMISGAGYAQGEEQRRQDIAAKRTVDQFTAQWINIAKNDPDTTPDELVNYARRLAKVEPGEFTGNPTDPKQVTQYLTQALAKGRKARLSTSPPPATKPELQDQTKSLPAQEPITIGGQKILPTDPMYSQIMKAVAPIVGTTQPAAAPTVANAQSPEEIRQQKQARAAQAAQAQMATNPAPTATDANQVGANAIGQMAGQLTQQSTTATPAAQPAATTSPAAPKVGPGVSPQATVAPSKVTYKMPVAEPAKPGFLQTATDKIRAKANPMQTAGKINLGNLVVEQIDIAEALWQKMKSKK